MRSLLAIVFLIGTTPLLAQSDTTRILTEVVVTAYKSNRPLSEVPAAIATVGEPQLLRFSNLSFLPAVNTVPGVRMEERSPGSYRFSIRGSSLRSPFGIRNVRFYLNGLPFTDGGGNTYFNLFDFNFLSGVEILKGPGASLYGAGTGGVVLLKRAQPDAYQSQANVLFGSYGLQSYHFNFTMPFKKWSFSSGFTIQKSDGYRAQSAMKRNNLFANADIDLGKKNDLSINALFSSLHYETPGGLTLAQFEADPRQARPTAGTALGAEDQQANVKNGTMYLGSSLQTNWSERVTTRSGAYLSQTEFRNPTIRNYESRSEFNYGGRTETQYTFAIDGIKAKLTGGAELQFFQSRVDVSGNDRGTKTDLQTSDKLKSQLYLFFAQTEIDLPKKFFVTLGASANALRYKDQQLTGAGDLLKSNFKTEVSPRIAVLKKLRGFSVYGNISRGFSPPTFSEALPSTGVYNKNLNAERGVSYEAGTRGKLFHLIDFDVAVYDFRLKNAIVIQRAADGADYFVNAGSTAQRGLEGKLSWNKIYLQRKVSQLNFWTTATVNDYHFKDYVQTTGDFSGNPITGVPPGIFVVGGDVSFQSGFYSNVTFTYTDHISLNDAASEYASDYSLLGAKAGYRRSWKKMRADFFAGIDNALNETYSLGNDINAVGGRYYNAAAGRNYYGGIRIFINARPM